MINKKREKDTTLSELDEEMRQPSESEILAIALLLHAGRLVLSEDGEDLIYEDEDLE